MLRDALLAGATKVFPPAGTVITSLPSKRRCHNVAKTGVDSGRFAETGSDSRTAGTRYLAKTCCQKSFAIINLENRVLRVRIPASPPTSYSLVAGSARQRPGGPREFTRRNPQSSQDAHSERPGTALVERLWAVALPGEAPKIEAVNWRPLRRAQVPAEEACRVYSSLSAPAGWNNGHSQRGFPNAGPQSESRASRLTVRRLEPVHHSRELSGESRGSRAPRTPERPQGLRPSVLLECDRRARSP